MSAPKSTPTHLPWATLCQSRLYPPVRDLGFWTIGQPHVWADFNSTPAGVISHIMTMNLGSKNEWLLLQKTRLRKVKQRETCLYKASLTALFTLHFLPKTYFWSGSVFCCLATSLLYFGKRGQPILFSVVFTPPLPSHHASVWLLPELTV
jgi:hypothetical protein